MLLHNNLFLFALSTSMVWCINTWNSRDTFVIFIPSFKRNLYSCSQKFSNRRYSSFSCIEDVPNSHRAEVTFIKKILIKKKKCVNCPFITWGVRLPTCMKNYHKMIWDWCPVPFCVSKTGHRKLLIIFSFVFNFQFCCIKNPGV